MVRLTSDGVKLASGPSFSREGVSSCGKTMAYAHLLHLTESIREKAKTFHEKEPKNQSKKLSLLKTNSTSRNPKKGKEGWKRKMCHPGLPSVSIRDQVVGGGWLFLEAVDTVAAHAQTEVAGGDGGGSGSGGLSSMKRCLCSPTRHPGSFRCRHHHAEYVWGGGITKK